MDAYAVVACPACRGETSSEIDFGRARLRRCETCGLTYADEMADPSAIYVDGYMTGESDLGFGLDAVDPQFQRYLVYYSHRRLDVIEKWAKPVGPLLDVGCGTGDFLVAARERGIDGVGVEPVKESVAIATERGIDAREAMLEESGLPESSYRTVTAFHVLEHMADGLGFVRMLTRWAQPGGNVVVEVPNWRSMDRRLKGDEWPGIRPLEHIAHYTPATLRATFERAGLEDVKVRSLMVRWPDQNLRYALADLGLRGLYKSRLARPFSIEREEDGAMVRYPRRGTRFALGCAARIYDAVGVGQVVLATGRRPRS